MCACTSEPCTCAPNCVWIWFLFWFLFCEGFSCIIAFYGYTNEMQWTTKAIIIEFHQIESWTFRDSGERRKMWKQCKHNTRFLDILWNSYQQRDKKKKWRKLFVLFFSSSFLYSQLLPLLTKSKNVRPKRPHSYADHETNTQFPFIDQLALADNWKSPSRVISATYSGDPETGNAAIRSTQ